MWLANHHLEQWLAQAGCLAPGGYIPVAAQNRSSFYFSKFCSVRTPVETASFIIILMYLALLSIHGMDQRRNRPWYRSYRTKQEKQKGNTREEQCSYWHWQLACILLLLAMDDLLLRTYIFCLLWLGTPKSPGSQWQGCSGQRQTRRLWTPDIETQQQVNAMYTKNIFNLVTLTLHI